MFSSKDHQLFLEIYFWTLDLVLLHSSSYVECRVKSSSWAGSCTQTSPSETTRTMYLDQAFICQSGIGIYIWTDSFKYIFVCSPDNFTFQCMKIEDDMTPFNSMTQHSMKVSYHRLASRLHYSKYMTAKNS